MYDGAMCLPGDGAFSRISWTWLDRAFLCVMFDLAVRRGYPVPNHPSALFMNCLTLTVFYSTPQMVRCNTAFFVFFVVVGVTRL